LPHVAEQQAGPDPDGSRKSYVLGPEDQRLRLVERNIDLGEEGRFMVGVAGDAAELDDEISAFNRAIATTLWCWRWCCCSPRCSRCASALLH
jgi:hypothetical protein